MDKQIQLLFLLIIFPLLAFNCLADENTGGLKEIALQNSCKIINYVNVPKEVKKLMKKEKCDVKGGSNYDYGYSVDLNDDCQREILFCCGEAPHGPCYMNIYGKVDGRWKNLTPDISFSGYGDDATPCLGFSILKSKNEDYRDIFQDGNRLQFHNGKYQIRPK